MMPEHLIFPPDINEYGKQKIINYNGVPILVNVEEGLKGTVIRVMSSNPSDFLIDNIVPGTIITLS